MIHVSVCIAFWYTLYPSLKILILLSDIARFAVQLSPFQGAIWCFSAPKMGHFASRNGAYCKTGKCSLKLICWYSISWENLLFPAYLRPKESRSVNTRLFFGVYKETKTEKSESSYNLKVAHIVSFQEKEISFQQNKKTLIWNQNHILFIESYHHCFFCWAVLCLPKTLYWIFHCVWIIFFIYQIIYRVCLIFLMFAVVSDLS